MFFRKIVILIWFFTRLLNKIFTFEKKIAFFLLTYSDFSYLWLRRKYSRSKEKIKNSYFYFVLCSLIRTFAPALKPRWRNR